MRSRGLVLVGAVAILTAGLAIGRATRPAGLAPAAPTTRLAGRSAGVVGRQGVAPGDLLMAGASTTLWTTGRHAVHVTSVVGFGGHGATLVDVRLAPASDDNPSFVGPVAPGDLQAVADHAATTSTGVAGPALTPLRGAHLSCCGAAYDLYLEAEVATAGRAGWIAGIHLTYEVAGQRRQVDLFAPLTWCAGDDTDPACQAVARAASMAMAMARG